MTEQRQISQAEAAYKLIKAAVWLGFIGILVWVWYIKPALHPKTTLTPTPIVYDRPPQ